MKEPPEFREHGMLFRDELVPPLLDGRKTNTRRPLVVRNSLVDGYSPKFWAQLDLANAWVDPGPSPAGNPGPYLKARRLSEHDTIHRIYSRIQPGDYIWARETWAPGEDCGLDILSGHVFRATFPPTLDDRHDAGLIHAPKRWRPGIHLHKSAARVWLHVDAVRPERIDSISESDAKAEGITPFPYDPEGDCWTAMPQDRKYRTAFEYKWNEIHGWAPNAFHSKEWVWVYAFKRVKQRERAA